MMDVCISLPVAFGELLPLPAGRVGLAILRRVVA
jgi:hypothetical protein